MKILVSALEPSSNLHLKEVLKHTGNIELIGIFSASLGDSLYDISQMAIMGVVDALKKLRWFVKAADEMVELARDVDKVLLMDSSGFNLPLAKKIKAAYPNKEIIYYILPQVWASRPKRVKKLEAYCDKLLGILPFEIDYYNKAKYVGHPLLDEIKVTNQNKRSDTIAFLPGSRASEVKRLMPIFKEVRKILIDKKAVLVIPSTLSNEKIQEWYGDTSSFKISRNTHDALAASEFAFICSGTATLESALIGTPFVLSYIAKPIDYFIGTKILGVKQIGLANIILEKYNGTTFHDEIVQNDVTVENLLNAYRETDRAVFAKSAKELRDYLSHGSSQNVANILMES